MRISFTVKIIFGICFLMLFSPVHSNVNCPILTSFEEGRIFYDKSSIPKKFYKMYHKKYDFRIKIANPGEDWNSTDMISKKENNSQLIFGGINKEVGFVFVKSAGIGIQKKCIIFDLKSKYIKSVGIDTTTSSVEELRRFIKEYLNC